jgi:hypothetical protein
MSREAAFARPSPAISKSAISKSANQQISKSANQQISNQQSAISNQSEI